MVSLFIQRTLSKGLRTKQVGSAGLDVYEEEKEYFYEDKSDKMIDDDVLARLLMVPNVVLNFSSGFLYQGSTLQYRCLNP